MLQVGIRGNFLVREFVLFTEDCGFCASSPWGSLAWSCTTHSIHNSVGPVGNTRRSCSNLSLNLDLPPKQHSKKTA